MAKSPNLKVTDKQLQTANILYIVDEIILSVTASKYGMMIEEKQFLFLIHPRELSQNVSPKEQSFLHPTKNCDPGIYPYLKYY